MPRLLTILLCTLLLSLSAQSAWPEAREYCRFQKRDLYRAVSKDGIAVLDLPTLNNSDNSTLAPITTIYGLHFGTSTIAIPKPLLRWHTVVNLRHQGMDVAVTYCPLSGAAVAFDGIHMGVTGLVLNSNMVFYDRATKSLVPQLYGEGIDGRLSGVELPTLPLVETDWQRWKTSYPHTLIVEPRTKNGIDYTHNPYAAYATSDELWFPVCITVSLLPAKSRVFVMEYKEETVAVHLDALMGGVHKDRRFSVGGLPVVLTYNAALNAVVSDVPVKQTTAYWFAWQALHPKTRLIK